MTINERTKKVILELQVEAWDSNLDAQFHTTWGNTGEALMWQEWSAACYAKIQDLKEHPL